jgi:hypothetical protein
MFPVELGVFFAEINVPVWSALEDRWASAECVDPDRKARKRITRKFPNEAIPSLEPSKFGVFETIALYVNNLRVRL